jgi:hypothetical protein
VYINVDDTSLSRKWLAALNNILDTGLHLEKNYCFLGWSQSARNSQYLLAQINASIAEINAADLGYTIDDVFTLDNTVSTSGGVDHAHFNQLHRYFEDLQGGSGHISKYYLAATPAVRWHIRQLNLLCHEFESWILSDRKRLTAPEWQRPSQLMCWLNAPRYTLDSADLELFGVDTINRSLGGVYVGVNKAVGKHHWEVFCDEGGDSRIDELTTTSLRTQTEAAGDFDIEWANNPGAYEWQQRKLVEFRSWLLNNGWDPEDKQLTIGHPQVAQVDLMRSFGTEDYRAIWSRLNTRLDVGAVRTSTASAVYDYSWSDPDYMQLQIKELE